MGWSGKLVSHTVGGRREARGPHCDLSNFGRPIAHGDAWLGKAVASLANFVLTSIAFVCIACAREWCYGSSAIDWAQR